jgi:hypothetical protein
MPTVPVFPAPDVPPLPPLPPPATDLPSALQAINTLRQIIMQLTNQIPDNNTGGGGGGRRPDQGAFAASNSKKSGNFVEQRQLRVTKKVRVFNPQDHTQFVDVEQITSQTFRNGLGQTLSWSQ